MRARPAKPLTRAGARERRGSRRKQVRNSRLRSPTHEVRVLDVSAEGLAVEAYQSLRVGALYRFTLVGADEPSRFQGKVLWCRLRHTRPLDNGDVLPVYHAGIRRS